MAWGREVENILVSEAGELSEEDELWQELTSSDKDDGLRGDKDTSYDELELSIECFSYESSPSVSISISTFIFMTRSLCIFSCVCVWMWTSDIYIKCRYAEKEADRKEVSYS